MSYEFPKDEDEFYKTDESQNYILIEKAIKYFFRSVNEDDNCTHMRLNPITKKLSFYILNEINGDDYIDFCGKLNQIDYNLYNLIGIEEYDFNKSNSYKIKINGNSIKKIINHSIDNSNGLFGSEINYTILDLIKDFMNNSIKVEGLEKTIKYNINKDNYKIFMGSYIVDVNINWFEPFFCLKENKSDNRISLITIIKDHFCVKNEHLITFEYIIDKYWNTCIYKEYENCSNLRLIYEKVCNCSNDIIELLKIIGKFSSRTTFTVKINKFIKSEITKYMLKYKVNGKPIKSKRGESLIFLK